MSMGGLIKKLVVERLSQTHPAEASEMHAARHSRLVLRFKLTRTTEGAL